MDLFKLVGRFVIDTGGMEAEMASIISQVSGAGDAFSQTGQQVSQAGQTMGEQVGKNSSFGKGSVWLGNMMSWLTIKAGKLGQNLIKSGFAYNSQMEQLTIGFSTMMGGNTEAAEGLVSELQQLAKVTPMETLGLAKTANLLMGYGTSAEDVIDTLTMLGDVAQGDQDKLDHLALAYGQAMAAGKLNAQDANQMINAGVPIWSMLADHMGLTVAEVRKMSEEGKITSDVLADVFKVATSDGGKYYKAMENQSKSYKGQLSTMHDLADQAKGTLMQPFFEVVSSDVFPKLVVILEKFTTWCADNKATLTEIATTIGGVVVNALYFLFDALTWIVNNKEASTAAIAAIAAAFIAFQLATHPIGTIIGFIISLIGILAANWEHLKPIFENVAAAVSNFFSTTLPDWWEDTIITPITTAWGKVKTAINNAIAAVSGFFNTSLPDWWNNNVIKPIKDAWNDITSAIDNAIISLQRFFGINAGSGVQQGASGVYHGGGAGGGNFESSTPIAVESNAGWDGTSTGFWGIPGFATGLDRVPRDNYLVRLHKDEAVLNATNAAVWRNGGGMGDTSRLEGLMAKLLGVMNQVVANTGRSQNIMLDSGVLVGQLAPKMDIQLGTFASKKGRGI